MDAPHVRIANHPDGSDVAVDSRQRGARRRRRERIARPLEYPGRHRCRGNLRQLARVPESPQSLGRGLRGLDGSHHSQAGQAQGVGLVQLLEQHAQVRGVLAQGHVRRRRYQGERLGVFLPAQGGPRILVGAYLGRHVPGQGERRGGVRHERGRHRAEFSEGDRGLEEGRLARGVRHLSRRDQRVLEISGHCRRGYEEHSD